MSTMDFELKVSKTFLHCKARAAVACTGYPQTISIGVQPCDSPLRGAPHYHLIHQVVFQTVLGDMDPKLWSMLYSLVGLWSWWNMPMTRQHCNVPKFIVVSVLYWSQSSASLTLRFCPSPVLKHPCSDFNSRTSGILLRRIQGSVELVQEPVGKASCDSRKSTTGLPLQCPHPGVAGG